MHKSIYALAFAASLALGATAVHAQTVFSANFDTAGYTANTFLSDGQTTTAGTSGQNGWLNTDPYNENAGSATEVVGGNDYVLSSTPQTVGSGNVALIGGTNRNQNGYINVPGAATSSIYHPFTLTAGTGRGYQFNVDFRVNVDQNATKLTDTFAFVLRNTAGTLLTINFSPTTSTTTPLRADIGYSVGNNAVTRTGNGVTLNGAYHLTIQVNPVANTYNAFYTGSGVTLNIASGSLAGAPITALNVDRVAAQWTLANQTRDTVGGYAGGSTDALIFDNYVVDYYNLVPEPSTYAACALGLGLLVVACKSRRRTC